jgi:hypothetical protein
VQEQEPAPSPPAKGGATKQQQQTPSKPAKSIAQTQQLRAHSQPAKKDGQTQQRAAPSPLAKGTNGASKKAQELAPTNKHSKESPLLQAASRGHVTGSISSGQQARVLASHATIAKAQPQQMKTAGT